MAELLGPDGPADELVSTGVGGIHVAGGTNLLARISLKPSNQLEFCHVP